MRGSGRREGQLERLRSAEREVFAHYGIDATSEMLELDGPIGRTRVVRVGSGPPTVLLHGGAMTSSVWAPLVPHLSGRSLLLVDLPGCGFADPFDYRGVDLAQHQTDFVASVLDALGLDRAALAGASLGGWFALRSALAHPERVSALALVTAPAVSLPGSRLSTSMAFASSRAGRTLGALRPIAVRGDDAPHARDDRRQGVGRHRPASRVRGVGCGVGARRADRGDPADVPVADPARASPGA